MSHPNINVTVTWTATLDGNGAVTADTFSFDPDPIELPYTGTDPSEEFWVYWNLTAVDQNGNAIPGVVFRATHAVQPDYPGTWGQPSETPGDPDQYRLSVQNLNDSGTDQTYNYTATVMYRGSQYTSDPEIVFETKR